MWTLGEFRQDHEDEIRNVLESMGVLSKNIPMGIRRWGPDVVEKLKECGHTSLEFINCECNPRRGSSYNSKEIIGFENKRV